MKLSFNNFEFKSKIAGFDYDHTIVKPKNGKKFPKDINDWQFIDMNIKSIFEKYIKNDYCIVIFTNQSKDWKIDQIKDVMKNLNLPIEVYISMDKTKYKPNIYLFEEFLKEHNKSNKDWDRINSFYVGDTAGRINDWSDNDIVFANNIGIRFFTPDVIFAHNITKKQDISKIDEQEIVIMMGYPGSGKTTIANDVFGILKTYKILHSEEFKTKAKIIKKAKEYLDLKMSIVIDATNSSRKSRSVYIELAKEYNIIIRCIHVATSYEESLRRNKDREKVVPTVALNVYKKNFESPHINEGFYDIITIYENVIKERIEKEKVAKVEKEKVAKVEKEKVAKVEKEKEPTVITIDESYSIFTKLYDIAANGKIKIWEISVNKKEGFAEIRTIYGYENGKMQEAIKEVKKGKNIGKKNETTSYEQALLEAKSKWEKKLNEGMKMSKHDLSISKKEKRDIYPMLALDYHKRYHDIQFPCLVQPKLDGVRCIAQSDYLTSRNMKEFMGLSHIKKELKDISYILDGELYSDKIDFQTLTGLINTKKDIDEEKMKKIDYIVYDMISDEDYEIRLKKLKELCDKYKFKYIKLHKTEECKTKDDVKNFHDKYVKEGYEGLIIRNKKGSYQEKYRSKNLQKFKEFQDNEFEIVNFTDGQGKEKGCQLLTNSYLLLVNY